MPYLATVARPSKSVQSNVRVYTHVSIVITLVCSNLIPSQRVLILDIMRMAYGG